MNSTEKIDVSDEANSLNKKYLRSVHNLSSLWKAYLELKPKLK